MKTIYYFIIFSLSFIFFSCESGPKKTLTVSELFSNHMVLQQQDDVNFWGEYSPEQKISITASWGTEITTIADSNGYWTTKLKTPKAGGPHIIKIKTRDSIITLNDVLVGEVWLASGQSNMEMPLKGWPPNDPILNSVEEIKNANFSDIRMLTVARNVSEEPIETISRKWKVSSSKTAGKFSASAYFFARRLHKELNVPVGIIHSSWGGTVAEAWTSKGSLKKLGDFNEAIKSLALIKDEKLVEEWFGDSVIQDLPKTKEEWNNINFSDFEATSANYDDSQWKTLNLPGRFDLLNHGEFNGAIWLRKKFLIEDILTDYVLKIGAIDDMDATYINGQKIGGLTGAGVHNTLREMTIPKGLLKKGSNTIAIRAIDTGGPGNVTGKMTISNTKGKIISIAGSWKHQIIAEIYLDKFYSYHLTTDISKRPAIFKIHPNMPTVLFNAMINPLTSYNIKGAIWYQGESNVGRSEQYKRLFPVMIEDWRNAWGYDFPFYFVQIAPFLYTQNPSDQVSQKLRDAQRYSLKTPNTGMVVTLDIGVPTNIHPGNKQDVGKRLAGLALANDYGKKIIASGPLFTHVEFLENSLLVNFDFVGGGLICSTPELSGFEIAGADGIFVPAKAKIVNNKVEVSNASINSPKYVRYAWSDYFDASLFNKERLPASSFTSNP